MPKTFPQIFDSFSSVMELLRDEQFQDLLVNYERAKRTFLVGYEIQDEVSSETLFEAEGKIDLKAADYLTAFSEFVKRKEREIQAIAILLNKPKDWNTSALNELRRKLKDNNYEEGDLRRAHKIVYQKEMIDIISMVKHAAKATEPLLTVEERVSLAIQKVTSGKQLTPEQESWMGYISEHLKQNLTLDEEDLAELPVFTDRGGLSKFKKVFQQDYAAIIREVNLAIAA